MRDPAATKPLTFFFLVLPYGISSGFVSIALPFILTRDGFPVATAASIVAIGVSANIWRFLWGPVADLTLIARRWYLLGLGTSALTLLILSLMPLHQSEVGILMTVVFISQVAATLIVLPVGGLMAHTVAEEAKGRAAGWYQAGNLGGTGIGGGAGVWLASHVSREAAGGALGLAMLASAAAIYFASDVRIISTESLGARMRILGRDIADLLRSAIPLFTIVLVCSPVGAAAMNNLWSAVAPDWRASANTVALVTGVMNAILSAIGCVVGGWIASSWTVVGLLWVGRRACFGCAHYGCDSADTANLLVWRSRLRLLRWSRVCCFFSRGAVCHRPRGRFYEVRNALIARKSSRRLHDGGGRLGTRLVWHQLDARGRCPFSCRMHRDCAFRFAENFGPACDYSALIKQSRIAFLHGR